MAEVSDGFMVGIRWLDNVTNMMQLDPTGGAKVAFSLCTKAWEHLESQEKQDDELNELVETIAGLIPAVDLVKNLANTSLSHTITSMLNEVENLSLFILKSKDRGLLDMQETTQQYVTRFRRLRGEFDTMVGTQVLADSTNENRAAQTERTSTKLRELKPVDLAGYDPERQCVAGTRTVILDELTDWARRSDPGSCFAWIRGHAGLGKSSIATSLCLRLNDQHVLASSFFCKRDNQELRDPRRVLTTIVYGLALRWEPYKVAVVAAIQEDPELHSRHLQPLYDLLIAKPLHRIAQDKPSLGVLTVVVDALDECGDASTRRQLLLCLRSMSQYGPWLRVLVTSRPDLDIQEFFKTGEADWFMQYDLAEHDASTDIRFYVQNTLRDIALTDDWPSDASDQIAHRASGLFIWARTACRFIIDGIDRPKRLELLLANSRLADIDSLYATAIKNSGLDAAEDNRTCMLQCLGAVVVTSTQAPLSAANLAALLKDRIPRRVLERVLQSLSSVLYVDLKLDGAIRISHPSFMDYLIDPKRSKDLWVDLSQHNATLAECCVSGMIQRLRFNICGLKTSDVFNSGVPDLSYRVEESISPHLRYCCFYWASHLVTAERKTRLEHLMRRFLLGPELMYWVEALSLLGRLDSGLASLLEFTQLQAPDTMRDCSAIANDAYRFVLSFYDPISKSTPHLYISALAFAPTNSLIVQRMRPHFSNLLHVVEGAQRDWTPCLRTISACSAVLSVAVSSDGRRIVSGCSDRTVQIWDAETGDTVLGLPKAHSEIVRSVAFSPDRQWIVSGSNDNTIRVWDARTGDARFDPIQAHSMSVFSVGFSADGSRIVSGSADETICVWDASTGKSLLGPLHGHSDQVRSVAFSPDVDGKWIVSGSGDKTVRVWNANSGDAVSHPLEGQAGVIYSVAFSYNGIMIASGSEDSTVRIWDATTGNALLAPLRGHSSLVWTVGFSLDSRQVVSGSGDRTVRIWDVKTGDVIR
ncbi:hypothetical protein FRC07_009574, partial [Ceratobasidium sp. 392]